ncbi:MAG: BAPKO_0422 family outer member beta-barrel protein [Spirochaetaceae bacterium]
MKRSGAVAALLASAFLFAPAADAAGEDSGIGVGFILGDPSGLSLVVADRVSLGIGWALANHLQISTDVWVLDRELENDVDWHVGLGAAVKVFNENARLTHTQRRESEALALGMRFPVAVQYPWTARVELFGEAAPGIEIYPGFDLDVDIGLGLRYRL